MFDLGFSEIVVIAIVLLVVVGPERLPKAARAAGHLLGRFHRYVAEVKADIRREIQLEELKKFQEDAQALNRTLRAEASDIQADVREALTFAETAPQADAPAAPETQRELDPGALPAQADKA
jgi:sec-independent protein translocase protein TatB